ncbi:MAG: 4a-hydroxytetrahydrobiopterin dehydratase [Gammaproteobacteria bacterium]|nr:4a-hydroxytetrahydrobiopterin dehydratase [Gammaproteobacteria bacterium]
MTEHCESCHIGMPLLSDTEVNAQLKTLTDWSHNSEKKLIEKTFNFKGYYQVMAFVNAVAWIAHQEKHHPDLQVNYNRVIVQYQTHEAGGVTKNDLICAKMVEALIQYK